MRRRLLRNRVLKTQNYESYLFVSFIVIVQAKLYMQIHLSEVPKKLSLKVTGWSIFDLHYADMTAVKMEVQWVLIFLLKDFIIQPSQNLVAEGVYISS